MLSSHLWLTLPFFVVVAALGVHCCIQAFCSFCEQLLTAGASLVAEHRPGAQASVVAAHGLSCLMVCGIRPPRPGVRLMSPALAGRFLSATPPGKS